MSFMSRRRISPKALPALLVLAALAPVVTGCSGDARPFEEAVEVRELDIASIEILPPLTGSLTKLFIDVGERADFDLAGLNRDGGVVELGDGGRDWFVDDGAIARIDDSGVLTGLGEGTVSVGVSVGGIRANTFPLTVRTATLETIDAIEGPDAPEACLASRYGAAGRFSDGSRRALPGATFTLTSGTAELREPTAGDGNLLSSGGVDLVPGDSGAVGLRASVGPVAFERTLAVASTLQSLTIPDASRSVRVDGSIDLTASATYARGVGTATVNVTDTVNWEVVTGTANATVSNTSPTRGRVFGTGEGNVIVEARCGEFSDTAQVIVTTSGNSAGLVFERDDLNLRVGDVLQLKVSTGSSYSSRDDVTEDARFDSSNDNVVDVVRFGSTGGTIEAIAAGEATIEATHDGDTATITVTVVNF